MGGNFAVLPPAATDPRVLGKRRKGTAFESVPQAQQVRAILSGLSGRCRSGCGYDKAPQKALKLDCQPAGVTRVLRCVDHDRPLQAVEAYGELLDEGPGLESQRFDLDLD